jgi:uncharacterized protein YndB with AHSA1/START domain
VGADEDLEMANIAGKKRTDSASRVIKASRRRIYEAFVDPEALVSWLPPKGMSGRIDAFDAREGGTYRMTLTYENADHPPLGKTSESSDTVEGRFLELVPDDRIVQAVEFESDDPASAGTMTMTWSLAAVPGGTEVTIICVNVPDGIRQEDHDAGLKSSLDNLAAFVE